MKKYKRIRIYKLARTLYSTKKIGDDWFYNCMCDAINEAYKQLYFDEWCPWNGDFSIFKEFWALKPEGKTEEDFWWNRRYRQIRIDKFDKILGE